MDINDLFDESWYLRSYPDVAEAVQAGEIDARTHFELFGKHEGRAPGPLFSSDYYLSKNPDVAAAVERGLTTAYDHFLNYGMAEGRSPIAYFDAAFYLKQNPDVAAAVHAGAMSAIEHFLFYGLAEGRTPVPWFDAGSYLAVNPDVENEWAGAAFEHLLLFGVFEDRDLGNGIRVDFFQYDPVFNAAMDANVFHDAVARLGAVAPFFPNFIPPPGWQAAPHTPIPIDFIPPPGMKLVVPPSVIIPDGMILPDTFEPVNPPGPKPDPDPGPSPKPDPDCDCEDGEGTVCLRDRDEYQIEEDVHRLVVLVDASFNSDIKVEGYETYLANEWIELGQIIDLSKVENLAVYDGPDGHRLEMRAHDGGDNLIISLRDGHDHMELIGAAGKIVDFYVGDTARSFGFQSVRADIKDLAPSFREAVSGDCGCPPDEMEPLWGAPGTLLLGSDGMQVLVVGEGNMALGGGGQDLFVLASQSSGDAGPAIIGDYRYDELDVIYVGPFLPPGKDVDPFDLEQLLSLSVHRAKSSLSPIDGLVRDDASEDLEVRVGDDVILHIASLHNPNGGAANHSVLFTPALGPVTAIVNIADGGKIDSIFSAEDRDAFFPYAFTDSSKVTFDAALTNYGLSDDDCTCSDDSSAGFLEILIGGDGAQTITAGNALISVLSGGGGCDTLTGSTALDLYFGGSGDDTIILATEEGSYGTVVFGSDAHDNGEDTIINFTSGEDGDMLDFSLFLSGELLTFEEIIGGRMFGAFSGEGSAAFGASRSPEPQTGNEQILIVSSSTEINETLFSELRGNRFVVLKGSTEEEDYDYAIFFVERRSDKIGFERVAELSLADTEPEPLCACNFSPWGAELTFT